MPSAQERAVPATSCEVLVIHRDAATAQHLATLLAAAGARVRIATDSLDGLVAVEQSLPALIVLDWHLPFTDGAIFLRALRAWTPTPPPVVALGADDDARDGIAAAGACAALTLADAPGRLARLMVAIVPAAAAAHSAPATATATGAPSAQS
jgi:DNA-binding response OmpR family regulator